MAVLRPASEMKDSGYPFIGTIPKEWKVVSINNIKDFNHPYPIGDGDHGQISPDDYLGEGVPYIRVQNMTWEGQLNLDNVVFISKEVNNANSKSILKPNDILVAKTGATIGKTAIIPETVQVANTTSSVGKLTVSPKYSSKYVYYVLSSDVCLIQMWIKAGQKTAQPGFNIVDLAAFRIPFPNVKEQKAIADYLDDRCSKIDEIIAEATDSIEEYKELKQAVIFEAVTKGLDKNVLMKGSGVEWIGKMPLTWNLIRIKYLLSEINNRSETGEEEPLSVSQVLGVVPSSMIAVANPASSTIGQKIVEPGDLVFNKLKAHLGVFFVSNYEGLVSPDYAVYRANENVNPKFLEYLFHTSACITEFKKYITGVAVGLMRLYTSDLFNIYVALPERSEQERIINHLNDIVHKYDDLISEKQALIDDLQAYKKSLIYEVVTGKRKIVNER